MKGRMAKNEIYLFGTCIASHLYPNLLDAVNGLLKAFGITPLREKEEGCCGLPAFSSGHFQIAKEMAKDFLAHFKDQDIPIVIPSGSCACMVKIHYKRLFEDNRHWKVLAEKVAMRTFELTQFLIQEVGLSKIQGRHNGRVLFHDSCQALRLLKIKDEPTLLLRKVEGISPAGPDFRIEDGERCCGFGGLFHKKYPEISAALRRSKVQKILQLNPDILVGLDMGCLYQLKKGLKGKKSIKVMHLAQFLFEALKNGEKG